MRNIRIIENKFLLAGASVLALGALSNAASAGGFAIGEQSTVFMGSASAGVAAGGSIGSMYWNPAAASSLPGTNTESSYTLILPRSTSTVTGIESPLGSGPIPAGTPGASSGNVAIDAATGASYGSYQVSRDLWLGMALNSPFGLATKPDNPSYMGSILGVTTKLITMDANPTVAYKIAPGVTIGAGLQIMWAQGKLQFNEDGQGSIAQFLGTDWAFGGTAGIMIEPAKGTTIGLGYRSGMDLNLGGNFRQPLAIAPTIPAGSYNATGSLKLPDLVTASFRQEVTPQTRLLGTVEWTNWSRFQSLDLVSDGAGGKLSIPANWSNGWFFSLGGEYDYSPVITLRTGVAYELSPEDDATKRFTTIPDNNRVWLNFGASYKWSETITLDFAYSHIFVQDGAFERASPTLPVTLTGEQVSSADLISVGLRSQW
ncbi:OmpP1/FadL family transporter [Hyphomicrobium sp.]|jgi:long-chain fatty acid transport protein|uniref:OmpP1/FadL family transporter n=1 Tax=Hyphomicrobium sp. TaxID=82 RepID=UPI0035636C75